MFVSRNSIQRLHRSMAHARTYDEWIELATELDRLEENDAWRGEPESPHYDAVLIKSYRDQMRMHRVSRDFGALKALIEESLHRSLGDLSNQALYEYSYVGTKHLIVDFLDEVERTFYWLCDEPLPEYPDELKLAMVKEALRVFGRSALVLSGGGALGLFHLGVVKALWDQELLPEIISGASMGAIVAGGICVRSDDELVEFWSNIDRIHRVAARIQPPTRWRKTRSLLDPSQLVEHVESNLADVTFREAYERSGRVLNVAVSPTRRRQKPRLLNHITAPDVLIPGAAVASCSLPALFPPGELTRRGADGSLRPYIEGEVWVDGSLHGDVPTMRLGRLLNVNHHIVSQANPHILPFAKLQGKKGMVPVAVDIATSSARAQARQALNIARRRMGQSLWRPGLEFAHAMMHQNYSGDINIHPNFAMTDLARVMSNPSLAELEGFIASGERATWPKLAMIRDQTRISRAMERCIRRLEARIKANNASA